MYNTVYLFIEFTTCGARILEYRYDKALQDFTSDYEKCIATLQLSATGYLA